MEYERFDPNLDPLLLRSAEVRERARLAIERSRKIQASMQQTQERTAKALQELRRSLERPSEMPDTAMTRFTGEHVQVAPL